MQNNLKGYTNFRKCVAPLALVYSTILVDFSISVLANLSPVGHWGGEYRYLLAANKAPVGQCSSKGTNDRPGYV
jgi:hypothetical protein